MKNKFGIHTFNNKAKIEHYNYEYLFTYSWNQPVLRKSVRI